MTEPLVLELTVPVITRISGDPALYQNAPFLSAMESATLNLHRKYRSVCTNCMKAAREKAFAAVANAMISLLVAEKAKPDNGLQGFKAAVGRIMRMPLHEISARYQLNGQTVELRF